MRPLPLILTGYGLAGAISVFVQLVTGNWIGALLILWLGGAVMTLALAAHPWTRKFFSPALSDAAPAVSVAENNDQSALAIAITRWERDRLADSAETKPSQARDTPC